MLNDNDTTITVNSPPKSPIEFLMYDIINTINTKVCNFYLEHPEAENATQNLEMVCMVTTNIFVNLLSNLIKSTITNESRLKVVTTCLQEVNRIAMDLWTAYEASRATQDITH